MPVSGVYRILNKTNGKAYIGSAVDVSGRLRTHKHQLRNGRHHSIKLQRAWLKYGEGAFLFELIEKVDVASLIDREQHHIDEYRAASDGYNIVPRAESNRGRTLSPEHRAKIGAASRGKPRSPETVEKIRAAQIGRKFSPEHLSKIRETRLRNGMTPEHLAALARGRVAALTGRPLSPEHRENISRSRVGTKLSIETRRKISAAKRGE